MWPFCFFLFSFQLLEVTTRGLGLGLGLASQQCQAAKTLLLTVVVNEHQLKAEGLQWLIITLHSYLLAAFKLAVYLAPLHGGRDTVKVHAEEPLHAAQHL